ncbi:MAG: hypothetical protein IJR99_05330, partial [Kiritimatiellae bacterium]|nr:hypothetical protein [Kiritimatiellia bacterium]
SRRVRKVREVVDDSLLCERGGLCVRLNLRVSVSQASTWITVKNADAPSFLRKAHPTPSTIR